MKDTNKIPSSSDWGELSDIDVRDSYGVFFGKDRTEVGKLFQVNIVRAYTSLNWMPIIPFGYYIIGLKEYIEDGCYNEIDMPDIVEAFISVIENKVKTHPDYMSKLIYQLYPLLDHIADHQNSYDADKDIYGDFRKRVSKIKEKLWNR
jgi:hypothetical protein